MVKSKEKLEKNEKNLKWVLPVEVHFNLMVDFEVLVLMVPTAKNKISKYL